VGILYYVPGGNPKPGVVMKNKTTLVIVIIVAGLFGVLILKNRWPHKEEQKTLSVQKKLPAFEFYNLDTRTIFSNKNIDHNKKICVVYFDPDCDYCESEISSIVKNISLFKETEILLISASQLQRIENISAKLHLNQFNNIHILWDKELRFESLFGKFIIPSSYLYNNDSTLLKEYHGLVDINAITQWLKV
jgi:peroxiredoxin